MIAASERGLAYMEKEGPIASEKLRVRAVKVIADGAMGSRGAWMLAPYADAPEPGWCGLPVTAEDALARIAERARARGFQVCVHAIGDRANRAVLDAFAKIPAAER